MAAGAHNSLIDHLSQSTGEMLGELQHDATVHLIDAVAAKEARAAEKGRHISRSVQKTAFEKAKSAAYVAYHHQMPIEVPASKAALKVIDQMSTK